MRLKKDRIKRSVEEFYGSLATRSDDPDRCCLPVGYGMEDLGALPRDAKSISLGCGNPVAFADIIPGEVVLDVGSGGSLDCILASRKVGQFGYVIGVDLSTRMALRAGKSLKEASVENVGLLVADAENLPIRSGAFNLALSNCVLNLTLNKGSAFKEILRILNGTGRFCLTDMVVDRDLSLKAREVLTLWSACIAGALDEDTYVRMLQETGFSSVKMISSAKLRYPVQDATLLGFGAKSDIREEMLKMDGKVGTIGLVACTV